MLDLEIIRFQLFFLLKYYSKGKCHCQHWGEFMWQMSPSILEFKIAMPL